MDSHDAPAPTLAAVRLARAQRVGLVRRFRMAGLITIGVIVIIVSAKRPGPGLHGESLAVLLAVAGVAAGGAAALIMRRSAGPLLAVPFALLLAGSAGLAWLQPDAGAGALGFFVAAAAATRLLPDRRPRIALAVGISGIGLVLVLAAGVLHSGGRHPGAGVAGLLIALLPGLAIAAALLTRRLDRDSYQIEGLLIDLEKAQDAEVRALALAERQRLAREMHDVLAHSLSGLTLHLEGARLLAIEDSASPRLADAIERAHHLARSGLHEARRAIGMLRDEELPGPERLAALAAEFSRDSGLPCELTITGEPHELGSQARLALYRVAQEALTNVRKHGHADRIELHLGYEPHGTRLTVQDYGRDRSKLAVAAAAGGGGGAAGGDGSHGYGLAGMRERAELLGGSLAASPTGDGFRVELWVPA